MVPPSSWKCLYQPTPPISFLRENRTRCFKLFISINIDLKFWQLIFGVRENFPIKSQNSKSDFRFNLTLTALLKIFLLGVDHVDVFLLKGCMCMGFVWILVPFSINTSTWKICSEIGNGMTKKGNSLQTALVFQTSTVRMKINWSLKFSSETSVMSRRRNRRAWCDHLGRPQIYCDKISIFDADNWEHCFDLKVSIFRNGERFKTENS